MDYKGVTYR